MKAETVLDGKVDIHSQIVEVPKVQRFCELLELSTRFVDIGDCKLYCEAEGHGTPLVLLHGGPGATHHYFHPHFSRAKDFAQVIYYDQRGCGLSEYNKAEGYSVDQAVDDLEHLRTSLGLDRWVVVGHSYNTIR